MLDIVYQNTARRRAAGGRMPVTPASPLEPAPSDRYATTSPAFGGGEPAPDLIRGYGGGCAGSVERSIVHESGSDSLA